MIFFKEPFIISERVDMVFLRHEFGNPEIWGEQHTGLVEGKGTGKGTMGNLTGGL